MKEDVSALIDNALDDEEIPAVVDALATEPELAQTWSAYALIGDVLRAHTPPAVDVIDAVVSAIQAPATDAPNTPRKPSRPLSM